MLYQSTPVHIICTVQCEDTCKGWLSPADRALIFILPCFDNQAKADRKLHVQVHVAFRKRVALSLRKVTTCLKRYSDLLELKYHATLLWQLKVQEQGFKAYEPLTIKL